MGEKKELLSGYFNAIKDILAEVVRDRLRVIDLGFQSYRMAGIVFEGFLYLGVFEIPYKESMNVESEIIDILGKIAECFTQKYQESLLHDDLVDLSEFEDFSKDLLRLGLPLSMDKCRNCLVDCVDENMGCLPHLIFFQEI
jgi:hypothetical protein